MIQIYDNLFIGSDFDCINTTPEMAIVHACKTCHSEMLGYNGSLPEAHPNYLIYEEGSHLFLNMVDMESDSLPGYTHQIIRTAVYFIDTFIQSKPVLIHCNEGQSRSPAVGLIYLARVGFINNNSYREAVAEFLELYPDYSPEKGLELYLQKYWNEILAL